MFVRVGQHEGDEVGKQVEHLVAQAGLTQQLGTAHQVVYGHVEVGVAAGPVVDPGDWVKISNSQ